VHCWLSPFSITIVFAIYSPENEEVELWFELEEQNTKVRSRLQVQRNPESKNSKAALVLDGDELELVSLKIDGQLLKEKHYHYP